MLDVCPLTTGLGKDEVGSRSLVSTQIGEMDSCVKARVAKGIPKVAIILDAGLECGTVLLRGEAGEHAFAKEARCCA
jgi:hypothetical protein